MIDDERRDRSGFILTVVLACSLFLVSSGSQSCFAAKHRAVHRASPTQAAPPRMPQNPNEMNNYAVSLGQRGNWDQAVQWHEKALNADPYNPSFRTNLSAALLGYGKYLLSKNDAYKAVTKLHYALYVDPNNREAEDVLDVALKRTNKNPESPQVREKLRDDYDANGNYIEAIAEARKVVRMKDDGPSHFALGRELLKMGSQVPAKQVDGYAEMKLAVTKAWNPQDKNEKALCFAQLGDTLKDLATIAQQNANNKVAMQRLENAAICYRRAVQTNPLNTDAINGLVEVAREAVAIAPTFNNNLMLAGAYQLIPDFEHAKRQYETCWKLDRNNPALAQARKSFHLSVVSSSQASQPMLATTMQKVEDELRKNPTDAELLYIYGRGKEAQGDRESAVRAYQEAMKINGDVNPNLKPRLAALLGGGSVASANGAAGAGRGLSAGSEGSLFGKPPGAQGAQGAPGAGGTGGAQAPGGGAPGAPGAPGSPGAQSPGYAQQTREIADMNAKFTAGQLDEAEKVGTKLLDKDPQNAHVWKTMGQISDKKGDFEQASADFRMAAGLGDKESEGLLEQVRAKRIKPMMDEATKAEKSGDLHKALDDLREASNIAPNEAVIHRKIAEILRHMGDTQEADKEMTKAQEIEKKGGK